MNLIRQMEARETQSKRSLELSRNELAAAQAALIDAQTELKMLRDGEGSATDAAEFDELKARLQEEISTRQAAEAKARQEGVAKIEASQELAISEAARQQACEELERSYAEARAASAKVSETLLAVESRLNAETQAKLALSKRVDELQEQLASSAAASAAAAAAVSSHATDAASIHADSMAGAAPNDSAAPRRSRAARASSKPPPLAESTTHNEQTNRASKRSSAGDAIDEGADADTSPKRARGSVEVTRNLVEVEHLVKPSKFKQLRNTVWPSKKDSEAVDSARSGDGDISRASFALKTDKITNPTPVARRTRSARRSTAVA